VGALGTHREGCSDLATLTNVGRGPVRGWVAVKAPWCRPS
jgi:hypothetical protein